MEHVKEVLGWKKKNKYEENCYMYLDMVRIGEKMMESCWYSLCVYKKKTKRDTKLDSEKRRNEMKSWKKNANQRSTWIK